MRRVLEVAGRRCLLACAAALLFGCSADPLEQARRLQDEGRFQTSLEGLRELVASRPDDPEVQFRYGVALSRTGDPGMALWSLRKAMEQSQWRVRAGVELAAASLMAGNWPVAIEAADAVLSVEEDHVRAIALRGEARLNQKSDPELALADFERALALEPDNLVIQTSRVAALLLLRRLEEAGAALESIEAQGTDGVLPEASLGQLCATRAVFASERGDADAAEATLESCLERFPAHSAVLSEALAFFDGRGETARGTDLLRRALERAPNAMAYRLRLAERLREGGDAAGAEQLLREALGSRHPQREREAWTALANHFLALEELDASVEAFEHALDGLPELDQNTLLAYADLLARAGRHERALEVAEQLASPAQRQLVAARVDLDDGRPGLALKRLDKALQFWPNNPGARYYAARAAEQIGDFERAIEEYRQSVRADPAFTESGLRLAKLYAAERAFESAWVSARHHFDAHPQDADAMRFLVELAMRAWPERRLPVLLRELRATPHWADAVAIGAESMAAQLGPEAGIERIAQAQLDLTDPKHAAALRALVGLRAAADQVEQARADVEAARAAQPESADSLEAHALLLEGLDAPLPELEAAYVAVVERDPHNARAWTALGRIAESRGEIAEALAHYDRATAERMALPVAARRAAQLAATAGREDEAESRWEAFLREHPWDPAAALALVQLRRARGLTDERTLELAARALRFGGGQAARLQLAQLYEARGEPDRAAAVLEDGAPPPGAPAAHPPRGLDLEGPDSCIFEPKGLK